MPYHNPQVGPVIIAAPVAFFQFPPGSYSVAGWDATLAPYATNAGLTLVTAVPAGATLARCNISVTPEDETTVNRIDSNVSEIKSTVDGVAPIVGEIKSTVDTTEDTLGDVRQDQLVAAHREHARVRVYPRIPSDVLQLTPAAIADTWGNWTSLIPVDTIDVPYHIVGVAMEDCEGVDTFMLQFARAAVPTDLEILGETRFLYGAAARPLPSNILDILANTVPANGGVWGRMMAATAGGLWLRFSLAVTRHIAHRGELEHWPNWPW